ncbi:hypothetical protein EMMF5_000012 [Cystobasidiomycetes sp. EMM_F5]
MARSPIEAFFFKNGDGRLSSSSRLYLGATFGNAAANEARDAVEVAAGIEGGAVAVRDIGCGRFDGLTEVVASEAELSLRLVCIANPSGKVAVDIGLAGGAWVKLKLGTVADDGPFWRDPARDEGGARIVGESLRDPPEDFKLCIDLLDAIPRLRPSVAGVLTPFLIGVSPSTAITFCKLWTEYRLDGYSSDIV